MNDLHNIWNRRSKVLNTMARALTQVTAVQQRQLLFSTIFFGFVSSLKLSRRLLCSVRFVFISTFNLQRGRAFVVGITNLSKQAVCVKAKAPADQVYQRRTWDEFKRVLSVAHASQPAERAENLEYRNQLSGMCWGAVYSSIESIFFNQPVRLYHDARSSERQILFNVLSQKCWPSWYDICASELLIFNLLRIFHSKFAIYNFCRKRYTFSFSFFTLYSSFNLSTDLT